MKLKIYDICSAAVVCGLLICTLTSVLREPRTMSEKENRELATFPKVTTQKIFDGSFMTEFETYVADQFIWRDFAVTLKADSERVLGKKGNNGIHFGSDGYLIARPNHANKDNIEKNIEAIKTIQEKGGYNMTVSLVPTAFEILKEKLPSYAYNNSIINISKIASDYAQGTNIKICDVTPLLKEHKDEYIYYRTDHHQTALGSYYTYSALGEYLEFEPYPIDSFKRDILAENFLGTSWSKSSVTFVKSDNIERFTLLGGTTTKTEFPLENKSIPGMYAIKNIDKKDKYTVYLDGNHGLTVINSQLETGKQLLILKDSYAHSVAPFLANHYDKIHLIDMRYYTNDLIRYIGENNISDILVLYSADNFSDDTNLTKAGEWALTTDYYIQPPYGILGEQPPVGDEYFQDAVMFGDSLTHAHAAFATTPIHFVSKSAVNTQTIHTALMPSGRTVMQELLATRGVNKYYLMLGINEISFRDIDTYISNYSKIIDMIRQNNPDSIIYIQSIMPIERKVENRKIYKKQIDKANRALMDLAVEKECYYLAANESIAEKDGYLRDGAAEDGIHVGKTDHDKWEQYLKTHAVGIPGSTITTSVFNLYLGGGKIDYAAYADKMLSSVNFKDNLSEIKDNVIARIYGIEEGEALGGCVYMSGGSTAEEFAIFETDSPQKAQAIGEKLRARVQNRKPDFETYKPEEMAKLNNPLIVVSKNVAMLCISDDNEAAKAVMENY